MTNDDSRLGIFITTCDEMLFCLKTFCYLFNHYWPTKTTINILGYAEPDFELPDNVLFHSLGKDEGAENWSNDMINYFSNNDEYEYFMMAPEDGFIIKEVDLNLLETALYFSKKVYDYDQSFLRFGLTNCVSSRPHTILHQGNENNIIMSNYGVDYRHSLQHSIWNRKNFLKMLRPNMSPWQIELDESARYDQMSVLAFSGKVPIHVGHGYSKGKKIKNWYQDVWRGLNGFKGLDNVHIEFIEKNGWLPEIKSKTNRDSSGNIIM